MCVRERTQQTSIPESKTKIMGDVAARREARRRKILQNSEDRLKKISGVEQKTVQNDCIGKHALEEDFRDENPNFFDTVNSHPLLHNKENGGEFSSPPSENVQAGRESDGLYKHKIFIMIGLAILANVTCLLEQLYLNIDLHFNVIFIPFLIFEVLLFFGDNADNDSHSRQRNQVLSLLLAGCKLDGALSAALKYLDFVSRILQDAMVYFFVFVCCDLLKIAVYGV